MIKRIILHIGVHKTATTTIQNTLTTEREKLAETGVLYPLFRAGKNIFNNHSIPFFSLFCANPAQYHINISYGHTSAESIRKLHQDYMDQIREQTSSFPGDTMVLSGEDISNLNIKQLNKLKEFFEEAIQPDINIRIVVVCRHPVSRFRSSVQFTVSNFGMRMKKAVEYHSVKKNHYQTLITNFSAVFGRENITVLKYEDILVNPFGPAGALLEIIHPSIPGRIKPQIVFENSGVAYEAVILSNAINHAWPDAPGFSLHAERLFPIAGFLKNLPGSKFALPKRLSHKVWKARLEDIKWLTTEFSLPAYTESEAVIPPVADYWGHCTMQYLEENIDHLPPFYRKLIGLALLKTVLFSQMISLKKRIGVASFLISHRTTLFSSQKE